jgi:hypothetical protein
LGFKSPPRRGKVDESHRKLFKPDHQKGQRLTQESPYPDGSIKFPSPSSGLREVFHGFAGEQEVKCWTKSRVLEEPAAGDSGHLEALI